MSDFARRELNERITLECPEECVSTCGAIEYALEAAKSIEQRALEVGHLSQADEAPIEVTCSGMQAKYRFFGKIVCPQKMNVTIQSDRPYTHAVDFGYFNSSRNQPDFEL